MIFILICFYTPVFDGMYYSIALSVCSSVCPTVCPGLVGRTVSSRILQLGTIDQHDRRKMPIVFQGRWSKGKSYCHIVGKRRRQDQECTVSFWTIQLNTIDHHDKRKMPIVFQGRWSKIKVVLSHRRIYIVGRILTEPI